VLYTKDFIQEYLLARAIANRVDPYQSIQTLADRYLGALPVPVFDHPTPHPPTAGLLTMPLAALSYQTAAAVWLVFELACLGVSVALLASMTAPRLPAWGKAAITIMALAWYPVFWDLGLGQVMLPILALLVGARLALLNGRAALAGALIGMAVLFKPVPWPLLLVLAWHRAWRALGAAVAVIVVGYTVVALLVGPTVLVNYATAVLPAVSEMYRASPANQSAWSLAWRLFHGMDVVRAGEAAVEPLVVFPAAQSLSGLAPLLLALGVATVVRPRRDLDGSFALATGASILLAPVAWGHYLVLAAIPMSYVGRRLAGGGLSRPLANAALLVAALLLLPEVSWRRLALVLAGQSPGDPSALTFLPGLLTFGPALAVFMLTGLVAAMLASSAPGLPRRRAALDD
jgi:hypothetical protein